MISIVLLDYSDDFLIYWFVHLTHRILLLWSPPPASCLR